MTPQEQAQLAAIKRNMVLTQVLGFPGTLMIGLGIYGLFGNGAELHKVLTEPLHCYALIAAGGMITLWEGLKIIKLARQRKQLEDKIVQK
ncbi:hypothetical protein [Shewanella sp.]|uniref:hypothetical protein n=1 Tax=Shewanella sp. TaxID=50422 RepID=UPI0035658880